MPNEDIPFRWIAEYTYDWETWVDAAGAVRWVNPAVERITGFSAQECLAMDDYPLELVHVPDRPGIREVLEHAATGRSGNHYEFRIVRKDGRLRWGAISWQPIVDPEGLPLGYRTSVRDIEERKRMEGELREAVRHAEEANRAKTAFLANVSHELRTPLQSILGFGELLLGKSKGALGQEQAGYVRTIVEQGKQLESLVLDLLDYSSLQAGMLPVAAQPFQPRSVVRGVCSALQPLAQAKNLDLSIDDSELPEQAVGDARRVAQVLTNLVQNSIKFTESGQIRITAREVPADKEWEVNVDDTGRGLPADLDVFQPFKRGKDDNTAQPGMGLGLAISRQLCRRLGGSLQGGESPLGGARLTARFALASAPPAELERMDSELPQVGAADAADVAASASVAGSGQLPLETLVIDDVAPTREFLSEALAMLGHEVKAAENADIGFSLAESQSPDLILIDIQMPEVDGWSAARGLRVRLGSEPFLVALSASGLAADEARLAAAGFDGFAQKPIDLRTLGRLVDRTYNRKIAGSELHRAEDRHRLELKYRQRALAALPEAIEALRAAWPDHGQVARAAHDLIALLSMAHHEEVSGPVRRLEASAADGELSESHFREVLAKLEELQAA